MGFLSNSLTFAGIFLQIALLTLILRGPVKRYFPLFLYVLSYVGVTLAEEWVLWKWGADREHYFDVYWGGELFLDMQLFLLLITLTLRALEGSPLRDKVLRLMGAAAVAVLLIPFVLFESQVYTTRWNDGASQLLNFAAAAMNLALWGALLISKRRDAQLLLVSAGLGVSLAGAAVTFGMRNFTVEETVGRTIADYLHRLLQIGSVVILCWAFWPRRKPAPVESPV